MHHPWRAFRELVDWTLHWSADLPADMFGYTDHAARRVVLALGLTQEERRCTIAHETQHIIAGPVAEHHRAREEMRADKEAARLLLPDIKVIGEALAWGRSNEEAATELWVDVDMLRCRLDNLHPAEKGYLRNRLAELE